MALPDLLFTCGELRGSLKAQTGKLAADVNAAPEEHVLRVDEDAWVEALAARWRVEAPRLDIERMWQDPAEEVQVDVRHDQMRGILDRSRPAFYPGYRVKVHIPFSGDATVFKLQPSSFTFNPPRAHVGSNELTDTVEYPHDGPVDISAHARGLASSVDKYLTWARNDIEQFNDDLEREARAAVMQRRQRITAHRVHVAETGLPVGRPDNTARTRIADAIVRMPAPVLPSLPDHEPMVLEPVLADAVFEHILSVIRSIGQDMERSPATYAGMGEEDRRQTLLAALNTHYRGQTVAEAFNVSGKTDLLVRHDAQNLFIGECKFWSGQKGFGETVDQLFGYRAWRDTKLAMVMFVRERDLTAIVEKARDALGDQDQFVAWGPTANETELRATMSWPGDDRRHADLAVLLIHTPA